MLFCEGKRRASRSDDPDYVYLSTEKECMWMIFSPLVSYPSKNVFLFRWGELIWKCSRPLFFFISHSYQLSLYMHVYMCVSVCANVFMCCYCVWKLLKSSELNTRPSYNDAKRSFSPSSIASNIFQWLFSTLHILHDFDPLKNHFDFVHKHPQEKRKHQHPTQSNNYISVIYIQNRKIKWKLHFIHNVNACRERQSIKWTRKKGKKIFYVL